jgi:PIN domain nuclease of toxin-antitoxin system
MRLLLGTHVWIWMLQGSPELPSRVRSLLEDDRHELFLSPISLWETVILAEKGRIAVEGDPVRWARDALARSLVKEAGLNWEVSLRSRQLPPDHDDPADRFIAATALVFGLRLVTLGERLRRIRQLDTIP